MIRRDRGPLLVIGSAALAVFCCAGAPVVGGAVASIGVAAAFAMGVGGVLAVGLLAAAVSVLRARRRRCHDAGIGGADRL